MEMSKIANILMVSLHVRWGYLEDHPTKWAKVVVPLAVAYPCPIYKCVKVHPSC
jgi:hypothetical protein